MRSNSQHPISAIDYVLNDTGRSLLASADSGGVVRVWEGTSAAELEVGVAIRNVRDVESRVLQCAMTGTLLSPLSTVLLCTNKESFSRRHNAQIKSPGADSQAQVCLIRVYHSDIHACVRRAGQVERRHARKYVWWALSTAGLQCSTSLVRVNAPSISMVDNIQLQERSAYSLRKDTRAA
jgi:hypothetical protein